MDRQRRQQRILGRLSAVLEQVEALHTDLGAASTGNAQLLARIGKLKLSFPAFDASWRRYFLGDVPWSHWVRPLLYWGVLIGLTYVVMLAFNVLIFRQWAYNEKLIYPLAQLPEILVGGTEGGRRVPAVFRNGLFWAGFTVSALFLGWNLLCHTQVLPGLKPLDLANTWGPYLKDTPLEGLTGSSAKCMVFFTMIGLAFLVPTGISFSLWFFWMIYLAELLIIVWLGYGQSDSSFPRDFYYTLHLRTSQGIGALMVFSSMVLFKCRKYMLCGLAPGAVSTLPRDEQLELRTASLIFLLGSVGIYLILWRSIGAHPFYVLVFCLVVLITTIGLIRAVAEGGILAFKAYAGPFHLIRNILGFDKAFSAPALFAPLMVYYAILCMDIKTYIAPAMGTCLKIRDSLKIHRFSFHFCLLVGIAGAAFIAVSASIMMSYAKGADAMNRWFYSGLPNSLFSRVEAMRNYAPEASPEQTGWIIVGAIAMALLLYLRRVVFWLPHPIGLVMFINPLMTSYWFSILIGWLAKSLSTKYGTKESYLRVRNFFIGLMVGELAIIALGMLLAYLLEAPIPIDLNRSGY